jgi:hypothetical protein
MSEKIIPVENGMELDNPCNDAEILRDGLKLDSPHDDETLHDDLKLDSLRDDAEADAEILREDPAASVQAVLY